MDKLRERASSRLYIGKGDRAYSVPDPTDPDVLESMNAARGPLGTLTRQDVCLILGMANTYLHLATHPAGTERMVEKLRTIRRIVKELAKEDKR